MRRAALIITITLACAALAGDASLARATGAAAPSVSLVVRDAAGYDDGATSVTAGTPLHAETTVDGGSGTPSGAVQASVYATADCTGAATALAPVPLSAVAIPSAHSIDVSNAGGDDSATTWFSNGVANVATGWGGGLFAGNDLANFASSSMGWLFRGVPLAAGDRVDRAYLALRIRKSRPNLPSENAGTWTTQVRAATGADTLDVSSRAAFLAQFDSPATPWSMPFSGAVSDPFGTGDGLTYAASPDITPAITARLAAPSWAPGGGIAIGLLNAGTVNIAEAEVVDQPDYARLHIDWTSFTSVQRADSSVWSATQGPLSVRAQYAGDAAYAPGDSACVALTVGPPDADGDGYSDAAEMALGKDPQVYCATMRADVDGSGAVTILDLSRIGGVFGQAVPPAPARYDQDANRSINIIDLSRAAAVYGTSVAACP